MVSIISLVLFLFVLGLHTLFAAVLTRFFRLRLKTQIGWVSYTLGIVPVILFLSTLVMTGALAIGPNLGSPTVVFVVMIGFPLAVGITVDLLYVTQPEDVELPETQ